MAAASVQVQLKETGNAVCSLVLSKPFGVDEGSVFKPRAPPKAGKSAYLSHDAIVVVVIVIDQY